jgi:hypothetical protein
MTFYTNHKITFYWWYGIANSLHGVCIDSFVALLSRSRLDPDLYPGIQASFLQADTFLLSHDLQGIKACMEEED